MPNSTPGDAYDLRIGESRAARGVSQNLVAKFNAALDAVKKEDGGPLVGLGIGGEIREVPELKLDSKGSVDDGSLARTGDAVLRAIQGNGTRADLAPLQKLQSALGTIKLLDNLADEGAGAPDHLLHGDAPGDAASSRPVPESVKAWDRSASKDLQDAVRLAPNDR